MARQLLFARVKRELAVRDGSPVPGSSALTPTSSPDDEILPDGHMRLYSFYTPALQGGEYTVSASQTITAYKENTQQTRTIQNQHLIKSNSSTPVYTPGDAVLQYFNVVAPQFSLDPKLINSCYPPSGHQDEGRILPHIVFNDPHVPWLRAAGDTHWAKDAVAGAPDGQSWAGRTKVPWMALLVLDPHDVVVDDTAVAALGLETLESWKKGNGKPLPGGAYAMKVSEYMGLKSRVAVETGLHEGSKDLEKLVNSSEQTSIIFPTKNLVRSIFSTDAAGTSLTPLNSLQLLSHVRHVNNRGLPDYDPLESTYFSVMVAGMTGNVRTTQLTPQIVHLVSIEHLDSTMTTGMMGPSDRIGLVSLYTWTYGCIPESADFATTMENLAANAQPLRAPDTALQGLELALKNETDPAKVAGMTAMSKRMKHGYTIARWRDSVGEESAAFTRGPLVPSHLPSSSPPVGSVPAHQPSPDWPVTSMSGKNYLIWDPTVGLLDATYASAWSLGKLMAISDGTFTTALTRLRGRTRGMASSAALTTANGLMSAESTLSNIADAVSGAKALAKGNFVGTPMRLAPAPVARPKSLLHHEVKAILPAKIHEAVQIRTAAASGGVWSGLDGAKANDSDWEIVSNWVHDALYLARIPAHYLFPDPAFLRSYVDKSTLPKDLPKLHPEALRFFSIDDAWLDCYIDGALSCANHIDPQHDSVRLSIKHMINDALRTGGPGGTPIPVPRSGFVIRSSAIKTAPDLKISATRFTQDAAGTWQEDAAYDPLLRHTRLDEFTIFCLFDSPLDQICKISIAQPPHQQRFALSVKVDADPNGNITGITPELQIKALYTNTSVAPEGYGKDGEWPELEAKYQLSETEQSALYNSTTRCVAPDQIARAVVGKLVAWNKDAPNAPFTDPVPDSCVLGVELNDPCYRLEINGIAPSFAKAQDNVRQLWVGKDDTIKGRLAGALTRVLRQSRSKEPVLESKIPTLRLPQGDANAAVHVPNAANRRQLYHRTAVTAHTMILDNKPSRAPTAYPPADWKDCQFELLVHPDYRQPPPRPNPAYQFSARALFSPQAQLPVTPIYLYDLVLAVRRRPRHTSGQWELSKLFIEIPVADPSDTHNANDRLWREPLLVGGDYAGRGVHMVSNQRFVPTLSSGLSSDDGKACLRVTLVPRSGDTQGTMVLADDAASAEASVRLAEVRLAPIADSRTRVLIATSGGKSQSSAAGQCFVKMTEVYSNGKQSQQSWAVVLKTTQRDKDRSGKEL